MRPPEEVLLKYLLPNIRGLLAHMLRERGYSQSRISAILGVSQAAVSGYLSEAPDTFLERLKSYGVPDEECNLLINSLIASAQEGPERLTHVLLLAWRRLLSNGYICRIHRDLYPELIDCEICLDLEGGQTPERERILEELKLASEEVEKSAELLLLYPEVSINIAMALENPSSLNDVAAFPGRLVRVGSRVVPVSRPTFGSSRHLASILLGVTRVVREKRCAMNLKLVEGVEDAISKAGYLYVRTTPTNKVRSEDDVVFDVIESVKREPRADAVLDEGGLGLEPALYIFGESPNVVVKKSITIARYLRAPRAP
ncbi:MAG: thiamine-phosphate synthase family protein [Nitrososphaerota archaeon]